MVRDSLFENEPIYVGQGNSTVNCKVLYEDLKLIDDTYCGQMFNYFYIMRIITTIMCFSLIIVMIFIPILGMRSYYNKNIYKKAAHL